MAPTTNSNRVYALIEAKDGGLYRTDDGGETWTLQNGDNRFKQRAWYYTHVFADPKNPDVVYVLNTASYRSIDGGKTFASICIRRTATTTASGSIPANPKRMIERQRRRRRLSPLTADAAGRVRGTSRPRSSITSLADNRFPYWIYGAQQDNSTVAIATAAATGGIGAPDLVRRRRR